MKTTSLELSKKLYGVFGWDGTNCYWYDDKHSDRFVTLAPHHYAVQDLPDNFEKLAPAYDTGFLLDKLPKFVGDDKVPHLLCLQPNPVGKGWMAFYRHKSISPSHRLVETSHVAEADIPSEALGNLALALKEKGLL